MDLIKIYEKNKKENEEFEKVKNDYKLKQEIRSFIADIIQGKENYYTNNKEFIDKLELSFKKKNNTGSLWSPSYIGYANYTIKINKTNINKLQKYLDKIKQENINE